MKESNAITPSSADDLLRDVRALIEQGRSQAAAAVNSALTLTYWHVGKRINEELLQGQRAEYGKQVVVSLADELVARYGKSFETRNLRRMMQFAEVFRRIRDCVTAGVTIELDPFHGAHGLAE